MYLTSSPDRIPRLRDSPGYPRHRRYRTERGTTWSRADGCMRFRRACSSCCFRVEVDGVARVWREWAWRHGFTWLIRVMRLIGGTPRSEERRVGKECGYG